MIRVIRLDTFLMIGDCGSMDTDQQFIQMKKARVISVDQQGKVMMQPVLGADKDDSIMIARAKVVFFYPAVDEMLDFYKKVTSEIIIAAPGDIPVEGPREGIRIVK